MDTDTKVFQTKTRTNNVPYRSKDNHDHFQPGDHYQSYHVNSALSL